MTLHLRRKHISCILLKLSIDLHVRPAVLTSDGNEIPTQYDVTIGNIFPDYVVFTILCKISNKKKKNRDQKEVKKPLKHQSFS